MERVLARTNLVLQIVFKFQEDKKIKDWEKKIIINFSGMTNGGIHNSIIPLNQSIAKVKVMIVQQVVVKKRNNPN